MAKVKFGMMMTDASGKLGGQVFAKNRGGSYVRTKGIPSNPQTTAQMYIRGIFAAISSGWSTLTESARLGWNNAVSGFATTDVFGDLRNPSGKALYQKLNQNLAISGQAAITVAPQPSEVPFAQVNAVDGDASTPLLEVTLDGDTTGSKIVVWATRPLSQGTSFVKNDLRQIGDFAGAVPGTIDITSAYTDKFGAFAAGDNIVIGVRVINANGQASPLETKKAVIVA